MTLATFEPRQMSRLTQRGLLRLQLRVTAEVHRSYAEFGAWLNGTLMEYADASGALTASTGPLLLNRLEVRWRQMQQKLRRVLYAAMEQAAGLVYARLWVEHNALMRQAVTESEESAAIAERPVSGQDLRAVVRMWLQRRDRALLAARERIYSDGFNLSQRLWRLENGGLGQLRGLVATALANRTSAAELARMATPMLGYGADCPRWAYRRLYGMTPSERASDRSGLRSGEECTGQGLAYNALRLARNEIQIAHHVMTDDIFRHAPWVTGERVRLNPGHPEPDICDEYASGGPYRPGEVQLPLHVQCMCYKESVRMPRDEFLAQVGGWMRGENDFLDDYAAWSGMGSSVVDALPLGMELAEVLEMWLSNAGDSQAEALAVG